MAGWQEKIDADMSISAKSSTHQAAISAKPLRGAPVLAREFVVDLANIDILAAIASCSRTNTASRPGHAMNVNRP